MSLRVIVIGAGLGGLTLARGLSQAGVEVVVYERDPEPDTRAQGARFHIDDRGVHALRACLPPEQFEYLMSTVGETSRTILRVGVVDGRLKVLGRSHHLGAEGNPGSVRPGWPMSRRLVRRLLMYGLDDQVRFGRQLVRYELRSGNAVRAHFADASTDCADILVGADGIGSVVRAQYLPHARVADTGMRWLGGKTPLTAQVLATGIPDLIGGSFSLIQLGKMGMTLGMVKFREPPSSAAARMLPGFDPGDAEDYLMWALIHGRDRLDRSDADLRTATGAELWTIAAELARGVHPDLRSVVDRAWPDETIHLQVGMAIPVEPWPTSIVTLLGDAIHAMSPNRGSGANTALQDASRLAAALVRVDRGERELLPAVADYEDQMRRDGFEAVTVSAATLDPSFFGAPGSPRTPTQWQPS